MGSLWIPLFFLALFFWLGFWSSVWFMKRTYIMPLLGRVARLERSVYKQKPKQPVTEEYAPRSRYYTVERQAQF